MSVRTGAEYWRRRAAEARTQAKELSDPAAKRTLSQIAESYERLAEQAERLRWRPSCKL
jgi:hypothetical protein